MFPIDKEHEIVQNLTPLMRYDGGDFGGWQTRVRDKLAELMGMQYMQACEPDVVAESEKTVDGVRETRLRFRSEPGYYVPCVLLRPEKPKGTVICLQGHSTGMHISLGEIKYEGDEKCMERWSYARQAVREGYAALAIEQRGFGETSRYAPRHDCMDIAFNAMLSGRTILADRVWDVMRAIDMLQGMGLGENIICTGNSGGGTATFYASCLEKRIGVAIPSCAFCTYGGSIGKVYHCACNYIPSAARYFDMGDLSGLIAPRVFIAVAGDEDDIFDYEGVKTAFSETKRLYTAAGVPDRCHLVTGRGGHRYYPAETWGAVREFCEK